MSKETKMPIPKGIKKILAVGSLLSILGLGTMVTCDILKNDLENRYWYESVTFNKEKYDIKQAESKNYDLGFGIGLGMAGLGCLCFASTINKYNENNNLEEQKVYK